MEVTYYALRDCRDDVVHYIGQTVNLASRKSFHVRGSATPTNKLLTEWTDSLRRDGHSPEFIQLGTIDLSFLPEDLAAKAKKRIERVLIDAAADAAIRHDVILLNIHGNKYREHNTGRTLVLETLLSDCCSITDAEIAATVAAARQPRLASLPAAGGTR